jgi:ankyrin repeat protein
MAAVRADEYVMAAFVVSQVNSQDINFESVLGDTALTIACRLGKIKFVELLLQNGASVNKETKTGRTALIEASKAPVENPAIVEFLVRSSAFNKTNGIIPKVITN